VRLLDTDDRSVIYQHSYFANNHFDTVRENYLDSMAKMSSLLDASRGNLYETSDSFGTLPIPSKIHVIQQTKLPRIDLSKFNGTLSEWFSFKDLFISMVIDNATLSPVEKLQYLLTSLVGSAAYFLKNTSLTADNFPKAWDALVSYYENKRLLVNASLQSLLNIKRMTKESASELEHLYTSVTQIYRSLEALQRPIAYWDDFLVFIIVQRLDAESVKAWEQHLGSSKEPPTWQQLKEFLFSRLLSLQAYEKSRTGKSFGSQDTSLTKVHHHGQAIRQQSQRLFTCSICSSTHHTASCPQYGTKSVQQRLALIDKHKLCYNCLGQHKSRDCRVTNRCQKCGRKHHTTIHTSSSQSSQLPSFND